MKKLLILAGVIALTATTQVFAQEEAALQPQGPCPIKNEAPAPQFGCPGKMHKPHFDMLKFEDELKLTDAQKAQAKQIREKAKTAMEPIKEQIKVKHQEMETIFNEKLTVKERQEKLAPIHKELHALKGQMRDIHKQSKDEFKAILTSKQVKKLDKLKADAKKEFKNCPRKARMDKRHHMNPVRPVCNCPPKPPVEE